VALNVIVDIALVLQSHFFAMQIFISFDFSLAARKVKKGFAQPVFEARLAKHIHTLLFLVSSGSRKTNAY